MTRPDCSPLLILLLLGLVVASTPAAARWYQVEVVTFRHVAGTGHDAQGSIADARPDFSRVVELSKPDGIEPSNNGAFVALDRNALRMAGVRRVLANSGAYEPLLTAGWRQPSYGVAGARRVYLSDVDKPLIDSTGLDRELSEDRQLEGIVSIKISRLMHIEVDFVYTHQGTPIRLHETRKAKLRELHYFDHPLFGVIVQVSPFVIAAVTETTTVGSEEPEDPGDGSAAIE